MDDPTLARIIIRRFNPKTDTGCVYATWRNSAFYGASPARPEDPATFFKEQTKRIAEILWDATVKVACLEDATDVIVGYSVITGDHLDWVYVKPSYREMGIGSLLVPSSVKSYTTEHTKLGRAVLARKQSKEN